MFPPRFRPLRCGRAAATTPPNTASSRAGYAARAVQLLPNGGQFGLPRSPGRTDTPHGGASCVQASCRNQEIPTENTPPPLFVIRGGALRQVCTCKIRVGHCNRKVEGPADSALITFACFLVVDCVITYSRAARCCLSAMHAWHSAVRLPFPHSRHSNIHAFDSTTA